MNKKQRKEKKGDLKRVPYEGDETERKRMHTLLNEKKGEMIKHLISRWHLYSKLSDTSDKETKNK